MAWLSRNNFTPSDYVHADDLNNLANDLRTWGGDVNGGGHVLANVVLSGSGGFQYYVSPLVITPGAFPSSVTQYDRTTATLQQLATWTVGQDGSAQTGGNVGANFAIARFDDTGAPLGVPPLVINRASGYIGMGVLNPAYPLDVAGDVNITGNFRINGAPFTGGVPPSRIIASGAGLTGGGDLSADRTLSVVSDTTTQKVIVLEGGSMIGTRRGLNFIQGANVGLTMADNAGSNWVDITIASTGGSGPGGSQTPWISDIDAASHRLNNASFITAAGIGIGATSVPDALTVSGLGTGTFAQIRMIQGTAPAAMFRNDGAYFYLLLSDNNNPYGGFNGLRPLSVNLTTGLMNVATTFQVTGPVTIGFSAPASQPGDLSVSRNGVPASGAIFFGNTLTNSLTFDGAAFRFSQGLGVGTGSAIYSPGDLAVSRNAAPTTGVIYFGNGGAAYIYYDGTNFNFTGANVVMPSVFAGTFQVSTGPKASSAGANLIFSSSGDGSAPMQATLTMVTDPTPTTRRLVINAIEQSIAWRNITLNEGAGNVGINTSNPTATLSTGSALSPIKIATYDAGSGSGFGIGVASGQLTFGAGISFASGVPQMVLTAGGFLGVGTTSPGYTLDINGNCNISGQYLVNGSPLSTTGGSNFWAAAGTGIWYGSPVGIGAAPGGNTPLQVNCQGPGGGTAIAIIQPNGSWGNTTQFNNFRFLTTSSNATDGNERPVAIGAGGISIGVGFHPPSYGENGALYINGNVGIGTNTANYMLQLGGDTAAKTATTTWTVTSDRRVKQNIQDLAGGLEVIQQLHAIQAEFNGLGGLPAGQRIVGFLADEVQLVLPGCVGSSPRKLHASDPESTDLLDLNIHEILIHLVLAVQQLAGRVSQL